METHSYITEIWWSIFYKFTRDVKFILLVEKRGGKSDKFEVDLNKIVEPENEN